MSDFNQFAGMTAAPDFEISVVPTLDLSDPADPLVIFGLGGTTYEAALIDADVGAVVLKYAADGAIVLSAGFFGLAVYLDGHGASAELVGNVVAMLKANPARD